MSSINSDMAWKSADPGSSAGREASVGLKPGLYKTKYNPAST
jgi:hypothetical protein